MALMHIKPHMTAGISSKRLISLGIPLILIFLKKGLMMQPPQIIKEFISSENCPEILWRIQAYVLLILGGKGPMPAVLKVHLKESMCLMFTP